MARKRREMDCEVVVEDFLKKAPRFAGTDGWFLMWCRKNNGGDPPYFQGPFKEDQLYVNFGELVTVYPQAGLEIMTTPGADTDDLFFPVLWGALTAFKVSDGTDPGWLYYEGKWVRMGSGNVQVNEDPVQQLAVVDKDE